MCNFLHSLHYTNFKVQRYTFFLIRQTFFYCYMICDEIFYKPNINILLLFHTVVKGAMPEAMTTRELWGCSHLPVHPTTVHFQNDC